MTLRSWELKLIKCLKNFWLAQSKSLRGNATFFTMCTCLSVNVRLKRWISIVQVKHSSLDFCLKSFHVSNLCQSDKWLLRKSRGASSANKKWCLPPMIVVVAIQNQYFKHDDQIDATICCCRHWISELIKNWSWLAVRLRAPIFRIK